MLISAVIGGGVTDQHPQVVSTTLNMHIHPLPRDTVQVVCFREAFFLINSSRMLCAVNVVLSAGVIRSWFQT